jgi:hypothetical protein
MWSNLDIKVIPFLTSMICRAINKRTRDLLVYHIYDITVFDLLILLALLRGMYFFYMIGWYQVLVGCFQLLIILTLLIIDVWGWGVSCISQHWDALQDWGLKPPTIDSVLPQAALPSQEVVPFEEVPEEKSWVSRHPYLLYCGIVVICTLSITLGVYLD